MENAIKTFTELAKISGLSGNEIEVANYIRSYLEPLGFRVYETDKEKFATGNCGNIIAQYGNGGEVALCAHMDTATDTGNVNVIVENGIIKSDGKQQLGVDCRLGVTVLLEAAKSVIYDNSNIPGITLIFTVQEETTMAGSKNITIPENIKHIFIFDSAYEPGFFIYGSSGAVQFKIEIFGKSAHAGIDPENGINVIEIIGKALSQIKQGRVDDETTVNIGFIKAGSAINVVPDYALIKGEVRSFAEHKVNEYLNVVLDIFNDEAEAIGAEAKIEFEWDFKPYTFNKNDEAYQIIFQAIQKNGLVPKPVLSYGGSDVNNFNERGIKAINIGTGAQNPHSNNEFVKIDHMIKDINLAKILLTNKFI